MNVAIGDWFARERVAEMIWRFWEPYADPFARCNIWFVRGRDRGLLVDTGLGVASLHDAARDLFEQPTLALATHYHFDHTGSLHEFAERLAHRAGWRTSRHRAIGGALRAMVPARDPEMYLESGYDVPDVLLDASARGVRRRRVRGRAVHVDKDAARRRHGRSRRSRGSRRFISRSFTGFDRSVRRVRGRALLSATWCTTGRCSTVGTKSPTSRCTSRRWNAYAPCR